MQTITYVKDSSKIEIIIQPVKEDDYKKITKSKFYFNWKTEKDNDVYKLMIAGTDEIVGLISLINYPEEQRHQINLLAVSKENRGKNKVYDKIAGNLIAFACRESMKLYGQDACVSLVPKTKLRPHYIKEYGMEDAGIQVFLGGINLIKLLEKYKI